MSSTYVSRAGFALNVSALPLRRVVLASTLTLLSFGMMVLLVYRFDALVALGIILFVAAAVTMLVRPELATLLTIFLIYINFPAILTKQHGLPHVVAGAIILLLAFPLLYALIIRREALRADPSFYMMLLLLAVFLISAQGAVDRSVALQFTKEFVLEGLLLYWLIFNVVRSMETLKRVIWVVLIAGAMLSTLSLYQTLTGSYQQEFGGLAYRSFEMIQDAPEREGPAKRRTWDRAGGPLNEPNRFAQILIVLIPLAVFKFRNARSSTLRSAAAVCGGLIVIGVLLTLSRGAFLALILMAVMMAMLRWVRLTHLVVAVILFASVAPWVPFFEQRMSGITRLVGLTSGENPRSDEIDSASLIRVTVMGAAVRVFRDHIFLGVGPGQFPPFYSQKYSADPDIKLRDLPPGNWRAHSLYLEIAAETGIIGLSIFVGIVILLLRKLWRARRHWLEQRPDVSDLATALGLSVVAYQITGVFLHLSYQPYYWFLLAITGAALHLMNVPNNTNRMNAERTWLPSR